MYMFLNERWEGRKKEASKVKQTRQSNTAHPRQSLFLEKTSCFRWDSNPQHSILQTERSTNWATEAAQLAGPKSHISCTCMCVVHIDIVLVYQCSLSPCTRWSSSRSLCPLCHSNSCRQRERDTLSRARMHKHTHTHTYIRAHTHTRTYTHITP